jgi:ABC-type amino acid transport substrate-binding protein
VAAGAGLVALTLGWLPGLSLAAPATAQSAQSAQVALPPLRVVLDDNYPPYIFRDESGQLQGILKDAWDLWSTQTGRPVDLMGMDWAKAQAVMRAGDADVIDTMFQTPARERLYDFGAGYNTIDVPL